MIFNFIAERRSPTYEEQVDWIMYLQLRSHLKDHDGNESDLRILAQAPSMFTCPQCWCKYPSVAYKDAIHAREAVVVMFVCANCSRGYSYTLTL